MQKITNIVPFPSADVDEQDSEIVIQLSKKEAAWLAAILGGTTIKEVERSVDRFLQHEYPKAISQTITSDPAHPSSYAQEFVGLLLDHFED